MASLFETITLLLIFSGGILSGAMILGAFNSNYGINADTSFNTTYSKLEAVTNKTNAAQSSFESSGASAVGVIYVITGAWNIILSLFSSVGLASAIVSDVGKEFGLPSWFGALIVAIIVIAIITAIVGAMLYRRDSI